MGERLGAREPIMMLVHIITLAMGLIIAYGLMQMIDVFQRRQHIRKACAEADRAGKSDEDGMPPTNAG